MPFFSYFFVKFYTSDENGADWNSDSDEVKRSYVIISLN